MKLLWYNKITSSNLSVNSEDPDYPIENCIDSRLVKPFRSWINDNIQITIDENITASYCFLLNHNIPEDATIQLLGYTTLNFVCAGIGGLLYSSPDGETWTSRTPAGGFSGDIYGVAYGNNTYVFVGGSGEIQSSFDGETWTSRTPAGGYSGTFTSIIYGGGQFVAIGTAGEIQTSPDGETWTARTPGGGFSGNFTGITYGNNTYVAVAQLGEIQSSPDGITWTSRTPAGGFSDNFYDITYGNNIFVAVGTAGEIQTSSDGITWTARTPGGAVGAFFAITWGRDIFVAAGTGANPVQTSPDGITWTVRTPDRAVDFYGACSNADYLMIIGATESIQISIDGITWTETNYNAVGSTFYNCFFGFFSVTNNLTWNEDYIYLNFTEIQYNYWKFIIDFDNDSNNDDYIEIGFLYLGTYLQMPGMEKTQQLPLNTESKQTISTGGQVYGDENYDFYNFKVKFPALTNAQRQSIDTMFKTIRNYIPVIVLIWSDDLEFQSPLYMIIDSKKLVWKKINSNKYGKCWAVEIPFREVF